MSSLLLLFLFERLAYLCNCNTRKYFSGCPFPLVITVNLSFLDAK